MENFLTIVHPISKNRISIFSSPGRNLLKSYLRTYKFGGEGDGELIKFLKSDDDNVINYIKTEAKYQNKFFKDINNNEKSISRILKKPYPMETLPGNKKIPDNLELRKRELSLLAYPKFYFKRIGELKETTDSDFIAGDDDTFMYDKLQIPTSDHHFLGVNIVVWRDQTHASINGMNLDELSDSKNNPFYGMTNFMYKEQFEDFCKAQGKVLFKGKCRNPTTPPPQ